MADNFNNDTNTIKPNRDDLYNNKKPGGNGQENPTPSSGMDRYHDDPDFDPKDNDGRPPTPPSNAPVKTYPAETQKQKDEPVMEDDGPDM